MALTPASSNSGTQSTPTKKAVKQTRTAGPTQRHSRFIEDPAQLRHIVCHLDKFVNAIQADDPSFNSWQDVQNAFEAYSTQTGKAPVGMRLFENESGDVGGFQFYLKQQPDKIVSGKSLVTKLNLDRKENYFTPSNFAKLVNLEGNSDLDAESLDDGIEELQPLENPASQPSNRFALDAIDDEDELDPKLNAPSASVQSTAVVSPSRQQKQRKTKGNNKQVRQQQGSMQEQWKEGRIINEVDDLGAGMAKQGSELSGLNPIGIGIQFGAGVASILANDDSLTRLYTRVQKKLAATIKRTNHVSAETDSFLNNINSEVESEAGSETQNFEQREVEQKTQQGDHEVPENSALSVPLEKASSVLGQQVNQIEAKLAPEAEQNKLFKPLAPLELDPQASLEQKLLLIEDYLNKINERLDRIEEALQSLKHQVDEQKAVLAALAQERPEATPAVADEIAAPPRHSSAPSAANRAVNQAEEAAKSEEQGSEEKSQSNSSFEQQRTVTQTIEAIPVVDSPIADTLIRWAWLTHEFNQEQYKDGIELSDTKVLYANPIEARQSALQGIQLDCKIQIVDSLHGTIAFDATQVANNQWKIQTDLLSDSDKRGILELPQERSVYESLVLGQELIEAIKEANPDVFAPNTSIAEAIVEIGRPGHKSDFRLEISPISTGPNQGKFFIEGYDTATNEPVFDAIASRQRGQATSISQNSIPNDYLRMLLKQEAEQEASPVSNPQQAIAKPSQSSISNIEL